MNEPVFLVGFMGSGKTHTGKLLARRLKWKWVDLDDMIVREAGKSIPEIFKADGETVFRGIERKCLLQVMQADSLVVSCGGGIVTRPENLQDLQKKSRVVCLRISAETAFRRVGNDPRRPMLQSTDPLARIRELLKEREPYYQSIAYQIDVDRLRASEVVNRIIHDLDLLPPGEAGALSL